MKTVSKVSKQTNGDIYSYVLKNKNVVNKTEICQKYLKYRTYVFWKTIILCFKCFHLMILRLGIYFSAHVWIFICPGFLFHNTSSRLICSLLRNVMDHAACFSVASIEIKSRMGNSAVVKLNLRFISPMVSIIIWGSGTFFISFFRSFSG